jgi:hypothetical protein
MTRRSKPLHFFILTLILKASLTTGWIGADRARAQSMGPFPVRDQFPVKLMFLSLQPESADILPPGGRSFSARFTCTNTYAVTRPVGNPRIPADYYRAAPLDEYRLFVDTETLRLTLDADWRVAGRLQVGATMPFLFQSGGFLDGAVEGFHRLFHLSNGGREETPRNAYGVYVVRNGRFWMRRDRAPSFRPGDMVFRVKWPLWFSEGRRPTLTLMGALKLPTGQFERLTGSGGVDVQAALLVLQPAGKRFFLHYNIACSRPGKPSRSAGFPVRSIRSQMLALEFRATPRMALIVQTLSNTSLFPDSALGPLDRTAYEISAGVKYALNSALRMEVSLMENLSQYQNTPDIGLHAGLTLWDVR